MYLRLLREFRSSLVLSMEGRKRRITADYRPVPSTAHIFLSENSTVVSTNPSYCNRHFLATFLYLAPRLYDLWNRPSVVNLKHMLAWFVGLRTCFFFFLADKSFLNGIFRVVKIHRTKRS